MRSCGDFKGGRSRQLRCFLKTSEPHAAEWISETVGEIEVERLKESRIMGMLGSKKSYAMEIGTGRSSWLRKSPARNR